MKIKMGKNGYQLMDFPSRMWRWMMVVINLHPPSCEQNESIPASTAGIKPELCLN
jgi:hypothetical protein